MTEADPVAVLVGLEERDGGFFIILEGPAGHVSMGPVPTEQRARAFMALTQGMIENFMKVTGIGYFTADLGGN